MYGQIYSNIMDRPGELANPVRGQLNREKCIFSYYCSRLRIWSRETGFGSPVPCQPAHLHTKAESGSYLRDFSRVPRRRPFICLNRHTGAALVGHHRPINMRLSFPHPLLVSSGHVDVVVLNFLCFKNSQARTRERWDDR